MRACMGTDCTLKRYRAQALSVMIESCAVSFGKLAGRLLPRDDEDCAIAQISGMVVTRHVPVPRSVRHLQA